MPTDFSSEDLQIASAGTLRKFLEPQLSAPKWRINQISVNRDYCCDPTLCHASFLQVTEQLNQQAQQYSDCATRSTNQCDAATFNTYFAKPHPDKFQRDKSHPTTKRTPASDRSTYQQQSGTNMSKNMSNCATQRRPKTIPPAVFQLACGTPS